MYIWNERAASILTEKHVTGPPDLVIEIGSKSTRKHDETIKLIKRIGEWDAMLRERRRAARKGRSSRGIVALSAETVH